MREATMCKIEGDDEFYHLEPQPGYIGNTSIYPEKYIASSAEAHTYCGKRVISRPHEWYYDSEWRPGKTTSLRTDFTWGHLKPCPVCQKNREEDERKAWHF